MYLESITIEWEPASASNVSAPTFTPAAGTYTSAQNVTLSAADGCTIYYTTDGTTEPTAETGTEYTAPISVSTTTTIKAIAVDANGEASSVATAEYIIREPVFAFSATTAEATMGKVFTAPTLTNEYTDATVSYSSSDTDVATVDAATGEVTLVGAGETTITATLSTDAAVTASYVLTVNAAAPVVTVTLPYEETFADGMGGFTTTATTWAHNASYSCMLANAYSSGKVADDWLVSPLLDLTDETAVVLQFDHAAAYFKDMPAMATLWARTDGGEWQQLTINTYPEVSGSWPFTTASVDLSSFAGSKIQIAFRYVSTENDCGGWEIKNVSVKAGEIAKVFAFSAETAEATMGEEFTAPTLTNEYTDATVSYSSSDTDVATVDAATGEVTLVGAGETTITATLSTDATVTASYVLTVKPAPVPAETATYKKITSLDEFVEGGAYLIVNEAGKKAMGTISSSKGTGIDVPTNTSTNMLTASTELDMTFEKQADGSYALKNSAGYIGYSSSTNFAAQVETLPSDDNKYLWTVSFTSAGNVEICNVGSTTRYIKFYSNNGDFRAYTSSNGAAIQLYKKTDGTEDPVSATLSFVAQDTDGAYYATFSNTDKDVVFTKDVVVSTVSVTDDSKLVITNLTADVYAVTDKTQEIVEGYYVPKNTGVLVYGIDASATYYFPEATQEAATVTGINMLKAPTADGVFEAESGYKYYRLAYDDYAAKTGLGFYWGAADGGAFSVKKGLAYLAVPPTVSGAAPARFVFDDGGTTGITTVVTAGAEPKEDVIYNMAGQRVSRAAAHGIYIVNGKKVVLK